MPIADYSTVSANVRRALGQDLPLSVIENLRAAMDLVHESCSVYWDRDAAQFFDHVSWFSQSVEEHYQRTSHFTVCNFRSAPQIHAMFVLDPFPHWEVVKVSGGSIYSGVRETMIWDYAPGEYLPKYRCEVCKLRSDDEPFKEVAKKPEIQCTCYGIFSRSHNPSRGCALHGRSD